jgi:hypothetical protein
MGLDYPVKVPATENTEFTEKTAFEIAGKRLIFRSSLKTCHESHLCELGDLGGYSTGVAG